MIIHLLCYALLPDVRFIDFKLLSGNSVKTVMNKLGCLVVLANRGSDDIRGYMVEHLRLAKNDIMFRYYKELLRATNCPPDDVKVYRSAYKKQESEGGVLTMDEATFIAQCHETRIRYRIGYDYQMASLVFPHLVVGRPDYTPPEKQHLLQSVERAQLLDYEITTGLHEGSVLESLQIPLPSGHMS